MAQPETSSLDSLSKSVEKLRTSIAETVDNKQELLGLYAKDISALVERAGKLYDSSPEEKRRLIKAAVQPLFETLEKWGIQMKDALEKGVDRIIQQFDPLDKPSFEKMLKTFDGEELKSFLGTLESPELSHEQMVRLEQVALMKTILSALALEFQKGGETWTLWAARLFVGESTEIKTAAQFQKAADEGMRKCAAGIIKNPNASLNSIAPKWITFFASPPALVNWVMPPIHFKEAKNTMDLNGIRAEAMGALRSLKHYSEARSIAKGVLEKPLNAAREAIPKEDQSRWLTHYKLIVYSNPAYDNLKKESGLPEGAVNEYLNTIAGEMAEVSLQQLAGKSVDPARLDPSVRSVWEQYNDMDGLQGYLNWSDENKDFIVKELCVNGALILAASVTGAGAAALAGRVVAQLSAETLSFVRTSSRMASYFMEGGRAAKGFELLGKGLEEAAKIGTDALVSELMSQGLTAFKNEEDLRTALEKSPDWVSNVLWNAAGGTLGGIGGNIAEKYPPKVLVGLAELITNPHVRGIAKALAVKGQAEMVGELLVGCVRDGLCTDPEKVQGASDLIYASYLQSYGGVGVEEFAEKLVKSAT